MWRLRTKGWQTPLPLLSSRPAGEILHSGCTRSLPLVEMTVVLSFYLIAKSSFTHKKAGDPTFFKLIIRDTLTEQLFSIAQ